MLNYKINFILLLVGIVVIIYFFDVYVCICIILFDRLFYI